MSKIWKKLRTASFKNAEIEEPLSEETIVVMKFNVHCDACCKDITKCIRKAPGVGSVIMDEENEAATVKGAFDAEKLKEYTFKKLKKRGQILSQQFRTGQGEGEIYDTVYKDI